MSLPSIYGGDPEDELEIWRAVIDPENLPKAESEDTAEDEGRSLSSLEYQTEQVAADESASGQLPSIEGWSNLTEVQREAILRLAASFLVDQDGEDTTD